MAAVFLPLVFRCNLYARHVRRATRRSTISRRTSLNSPISAKRERGSSVGKFFASRVRRLRCLAKARARGVPGTMHGGRAAEWTDLASPVETRELTVRLARKDNARHVAHVTVPYDRGTNRKLYVKVALTATWLRRVFADRPFSVRRARDVANATEIMSDKSTVMSAVSILEEMCRFHAHDVESVRRYSSACVCELAACAPPDFDFLFANDGDGDGEDDGALFAVRVGRVTGAKVHVYAAPSNTEKDAREAQRVVVFGAEADVQNTLSALTAMVDRVIGGESHVSARAWVLQYLNDVYSDAAARGECDDTGDGATWEDDKPTVILRCEQEVTSWLEEKERRAAATVVDDRSGAGVASYAAIVSATPKRPSQKTASEGPSEEDHSSSEGDSQDDSKAAAETGNGLAAASETPPAPPAASSGRMNPVMSATINHRAPAFASAPWTPPPPMVSPWANPAAAAAVAMMCRGCGCYPRRVAFLPCSHLALCLLCNDVTKKSNAPCVVCGAHVKERLIFYLD